MAHKFSNTAHAPPSEVKGLSWGPVNIDTIRVGDIVYLKGGSPAMTVTGLNNNDRSLNVAWVTREEEQLQQATFPPDALLAAYPQP